MLTSLQEIYPYMRFLRAPSSSTLGEFNARYLTAGNLEVRSKAVFSVLQWRNLTQTQADEEDKLAKLLEEVMLKRFVCRHSACGQVCF
jgi:hypothetical protein